MKIDVSEFAKPCGCGRPHEISVRGIWIEQGAIQRLPGLMKDSGWSWGVILCDVNTYRAAGAAVQALLPSFGLVTLNPENLHANEHGVAMAEQQLDAMEQAPQVLLAVGSGTVHDITRFIAHKRGLPFVSVPTAASVDGFVSTVAAMTWNGCKKTFPAVAPVLVVADSDIFSRAPHRLNASGFSDLLGKYTALADWKIAHAVTGEYLCDRVCRMEYDALRVICEKPEEIRAGGVESCEQLMYALLLSGLAMQMVGNSRPASGAEHHMSHLWEMEAINPHIDALHGEKVSVGLVLASGVYHRAAEEIRRGAYRLRGPVEVEMDLLRRSFRDKEMLEGILEENTPNPLENVLPDAIEKAIPEILRIIDEIPAPDALISMLDRAGAVKSLAEIHLPDSIAEQTEHLSPYVRARLTFMRMLKCFVFEKDVFQG